MPFSTSVVKILHTIYPRLLFVLTGTKDGQTKLVRIGDVVEAYSWSAADSNWNKIGDVVGDKDSENRPTTTRVMYEGKVGTN